MPRSAWRAACSIALAATIGLTSVTAGWAQTQYQQQPTQQQPNQQTQPYQQQQFLPQQPNDTVTRDVLGVFGTTPNQGQGSTVARPGTATQAEGGPTVAPAIGDTERRTAREELQPFGASLFAGTSPASSDTPNPSYVIQPGDRVAIKVWGGFDADTTSTVDPEGNVFLQGV